MIQQDLFLSQECTPETVAKDCTFCSNTSIPEFDINYPRSGLVHHCRSCYVEYGHAD
jgi:hypothetical protein